MDVGAESRAQSQGQWGQRPAPAPTLNGMHLSDSIAESVAEAGKAGYGLVHPGHGAVEAGV